ncbi:MAG: response regulator [Pseudobutyrivibrio sp.]|nr:response regulator [Pseudobutyrivibrio sp.]
MKKLKSLYKTFFSADLPTNVVMFNIITIIGFIGGLIALPFNVANHLPFVLTLTILVAIVVDLICIYLANFKNQLRNSTVAVCFVVIIIILPVMFFTTGGINSGIVCWFSMGLIFIFMLLDGMDFIFMLLTDAAVIVGCYVISYFHPEYVMDLTSRKAVFSDVIQALFITSTATGVIVKFQANIYNKLYAIAETNNDDLLEKTLAAKKAEKIAQSATEAKSTFLANMSHEIRTPINTIMGMDEMILRETSEKQVEEYALDIKTASQTLLTLINDILDITKIESGKMGIVEGEYAFMSMMHDVLNNVTIKAKEKNLEIISKVSSDIPSNLVGDDVRIKQVLTNILANAIKYTHEGSITVSVNSSKNLDGTVDLSFSIKDTGIGIKQEDMKRLFESFERLDISRNRNIEGAGLGMAITKNLLRMMGANLEVDSEYGKGSTFSFTINQGVTDYEPIGDFESSLSHMSSYYEYSASFEAPNARFLVVDDNAMNRKVFGSLLKESKVQVFEASGGEECLSMIKQEHFDMIFLDHMMPGLDGVATFKKMATLEDNKCLGTPVIALTANAIAGAREKYLTMGFHGFLSKPIVPAQLEKTIRDFLPEDLLEYHQEDENDLARKNRVYKVELPEIEGVDWEYALLHFPDTAMVYQTAIDFYDSIDFERDEIIRYYDSIDTDMPVEDYRIKVHGVKSMANTIGATSLGALAKTCEYAARDNQLDRIRVLTPILIEEMDNMKSRLSVLKSEVEKPMIQDMDELYALLEMLKMSLLTNNSEQADNIMKQINSYSYESEIQEAINVLNQHIINFEGDEALIDIDKLQQ